MFLLMNHYHYHESLILSQLISTRAKRGIHELGTVWKCLDGTPDHDDFIKIQNKINDLIKTITNNLLSIPNCLTR